MFQHLCTNAQAAVGGKAAEGHDVESSLTVQYVHAAAHTTNHHIIVVC